MLLSKRYAIYFIIDSQVIIVVAKINLFGYGTPCVLL